MTTIAISTPKNLREILPRTKTVSVALVFGFAVLTSLMAQISIPLGFTPVPISGQTFAVLLSGAVLGAKLGASSQLLYVVMGIVGMPVYQDASSGWKVFTGATGGYLFGFIVASFAIGYLAERNGDRNVVNALSNFVLGSVIIYLFGALWLAHIMNIPVVGEAPGVNDALGFGVVPFLIGDFIKAIAAGLFVPGVWKAIKFSTRNQ